MSKQKREVVVSKYWRCRKWAVRTNIKKENLLLNIYFLLETKLKLKRVWRYRRNYRRCREKPHECKSSITER